MFNLAITDVRQNMRSIANDIKPCERLYDIYAYQCANAWRICTGANEWLHSYIHIKARRACMEIQCWP